MLALALALRHRDFGFCFEGRGFGFGGSGFGFGFGGSGFGFGGSGFGFDISKPPEKFGVTSLTVKMQQNRMG